MGIATKEKQGTVKFSDRKTIDIFPQIDWEVNLFTHCSIDQSSRCQEIDSKKEEKADRIHHPMSGRKEPHFS